ncbi:MAG: YdeI/OmpD-associated family protein [Verrucomicrobia bacterium]|nr:YdeI/OmpD-associated family protein [Verrucomicrobiota bacterium]
MRILFFKSSSEFRQWLEENHDKTSELWVGFYKKDSGKTGVNYSEALDDALCFGWIDGIRKRVDARSYTCRFTPRKPKSTWSLINTQRGERLKKLGRMTPAGLKAFEGRRPNTTGIDSFENEARSLAPDFQRKFVANKPAWEFFQAQPPGYRRIASWWVMSAKREVTRLRRLACMISDSEKGARLGIVTGKSK